VSECERFLTALSRRTAAAWRRWRGSWVVGRGSATYVPSRAINTSAPARIVPSSAGAAKRFNNKLGVVSRGVALSAQNLAHSFSSDNVQLFSNTLSNAVGSDGGAVGDDAPSNLDAVADVVSQAQRPGRGSSPQYRSMARKSLAVGALNCKVV
jgi:hypothetical protein